MKNLISIIILIITFSTIVNATDDTIIDKQNRLLEKIDNILHRRGIWITGRGIVLYNYKFAEGYAIEDDLPVQSDVPLIQMDINFTATPVKYLSAGGVLRLQNNIRGFWGKGDTFTVRQCFAEAVFLRFIKLRIGHLLVSLSPLTLWAKYDEMEYDAKIFKIQAEREDALYQLYLTEKNKFPFEGAKIDFGFNLIPYETKGIYKFLPNNINFESFAAKVDTAEESSGYDRYFSGTRFSLLKEGVLKFGLTGVFLGDIKGTKSSGTLLPPIQAKIFASDFDVDFAPLFFLNKLEIYSEYGISSTKTNIDNKSEFKDYGFYTGIRLGILENIIELKYIDIGNEFFSPGTQTWLYSNYLWNSQIFDGQNLSGYEYINLFTREYNNKLQISRGWLRPLNLAKPFGDETPNRTGFSYRFTSKQIYFVEFMVCYDKLKEITPISTGGTIRNFEIIEIGGKLLLDVFLEESWMPNITSTFKQEKVKRMDNPDTTFINSQTGENLMDESENVKNTILSFGLEFKLTKKFELLAGFNRISQKGYFFSDDNNNNMPIVITGYDFFNVDKKTDVFAFGIKYDLNKLNSIRLTFTKIEYQNLKDKTKNYNISNVQLFYLLNF